MRINPVNIARCFLCVLLLLNVGPCFTNPPYAAEWESTVELAQLGKGDLDQTYHELLDYFFPRKLTLPMRGRCSLVLRYLPARGHEHQLNIQFIENATAPSLLGI